MCNNIKFCIFHPGNTTVIKIVNTQLDGLATFVLSAINCTYHSCTGICQIWLEIWPEPDLAGFLKNGQILNLPEPELKCGTTVSCTDIKVIIMQCGTDIIL